MQFGIADDGITQRAGQALSVVPQWKAAGMDVARVTLVWSRVAPEPLRTAKPAGFDAADPNAPGYNWAPVDDTVAALNREGITPILTLTAPAPYWASTDPSRRDAVWKPDPQAFADFAAAVAKRYRGQVRQYILYNEANLNIWLMPQWECRSGRCTHVAGHHYRKLVEKAYPAMKQADPAAQVLIGALAPAGASGRAANSRTRPLEFLRAMTCVDTRLRPIRGGKLCSGFKAPQGDGYAHHPHGGVRSPLSRGGGDDVRIADTPKLLKTLDTIQRAKRIRNGTSFTKKFDLYYDEYGYQTNPPDPYVGVTLANQALWLQQGAYLAWREPRVKLLVQYLWLDDPIGKSGNRAKDYGSWQSGLIFFDGRKKPALQSFPHPFWVDLPAGSRTATVWGQVRPGGSAKVTVERRTSGGFATLRETTTNANGYFRFSTPVSGKTSFRYRYVNPEGRTTTSATMTVTPSAAKPR
jgi:hypothetical protein